MNFLIVGTIRNCQRQIFQTIKCLDKGLYFASKIEYEWTPKPKFNINLKLLDFEFIKNRAINNYFYVYRNSYDRLNFISKSMIKLPVAFSRFNPIP